MAGLFLSPSPQPPATAGLEQALQMAAVISWQGWEQKDQGPQGDSYSISKGAKAVSDNLGFGKSRTISKDSHRIPPSQAKMTFSGTESGALRGWGHQEELAVECPQCLRAAEQKAMLVQMSPWSRAPPFFPHCCRSPSLFPRPISLSSYLPSSPLSL